MSDNKKYVVFVDDNYHYMDESERYKAGEYDTYDEAEAKCREIVQESVEASRYSYDNYVCFGDDPFIMGEDRLRHFYAWDYAKELCDQHTQSQSGSVSSKLGSHG